ncbi:unnamed protein product [Vitrella brassicaformis CCMP3155]|uniref:K Homology domain-containing protein n=1 Tax=Vitrella brassicaformis (strain CCMP3155) TaxID=1169540 RepID=A0A0G4F8A7_VITBC|nr:unnamed protein product [Vitrella brassicaformis CCMP3155]|eukprot:CEM08242.1 unnamed protein product [Vitrella brassicaformis CCMP3155]
MSYDEPQSKRPRVSRWSDTPDGASGSPSPPPPGGATGANLMPLGGGPTGATGANLMPLGGGGGMGMGMAPGANADIVSEARAKAMEALKRVQQGGGGQQWSWGTGKRESKTVDVPRHADLPFVRDLFSSVLYKDRFRDETRCSPTLRIDRTTNDLSIFLESDSRTDLDNAEQSLLQIFQADESIKSHLRNAYIVNQPVAPPADMSMSYGQWGPNSVREEMNVTNEQAGVVIGKGGENIRKLQADHRIKIQIHREPDGGTQRTVHFEGPREKIDAAKEDIKKLLAEVDQKQRDREARGIAPWEGYRPRGCSASLMIRNNHVGIVIGRKGESIRSVEERYQCKVIIQRDSEVTGDEREVEVRAMTQESANDARDYIQYLIESTLAASGEHYSFADRNGTALESRSRTGPPASWRGGPSPGPQAMYPPYGAPGGMGVGGFPPFFPPMGMGMPMMGMGMDMSQMWGADGTAMMNFGTAPGINPPEGPEGAGAAAGEGGEKKAEGEGADKEKEAAGTEGDGAEGEGKKAEGEEGDKKEGEGEKKADGEAGAAGAGDMTAMAAGGAGAGAGGGAAAGGDMSAMMGFNPMMMGAMGMGMGMTPEMMMQFMAMWQQDPNAYAMMYQNMYGQAAPGADTQAATTTDPTVTAQEQQQQQQQQDAPVTNGTTATDAAKPADAATSGEEPAAGEQRPTDGATDATPEGAPLPTANGESVPADKKEGEKQDDPASALPPGGGPEAPAAEGGGAASAETKGEDGKKDEEAKEQQQQQQEEPKKEGGGGGGVAYDDEMVMEDS